MKKQPKKITVKDTKEYSGEPWTADVRDEDVTDKDIESLRERLAGEGKKLTTLYVTDKQKEKLNVKDVTLIVE